MLMHAEPTTTPCAWPQCRNLVHHTPEMRRKPVYCSPACKQKAYRQRLRQSLDRNVTFWEQAVAALDHLDSRQLEQLRQQIDARLVPSLPPSEPQPRASSPKAPSVSKPAPPSPQDSALLYYRKAKGVIHLSVNRMASFCGRDLADMHETTPQESPLCQRCRHVRDTHTWWLGYRQAYGV